MIEIKTALPGPKAKQFLEEATRYEEVAGAYRQLRLDFSPCENFEVPEDRSGVATHLKGIVAKEREIVSALDRAIREIGAVPS